MDEIILEERKINKFPGPYHLECTPYYQIDFREETYKKCLREETRKRFSKEWLKISKVIVIGDVAVGKTCIINRYCRKIFDCNYKSTIGVDFEVEKFNILGVPYNLQIWDTAGQERFKSIAQSYYRGAHVVVLVFNLSDCGSLTNCKKWLNEALNANTANDPFLFLVGTKRDLLNNFSYKNIKFSAMTLAKDLNAEYWGVSAKSGKNVDKLFQRIAALTFDELIKKGYDTKKSEIKIGEKLIDDKSSNVSKNNLVRQCCV